MADRSVDVLIIGGGFTGLAAARELSRAGIDFLLVDSFGDHLGGRAFSFDSPVGDGLRFDHGAQYVGDLQNAIMAEIRELLEPDELVNGAALRLPYPWEVMVLDQKRMAFKSTSSLFGIPGAPPQLGLSGALEMVGLLAEMTLIECTIDTVTPWEGPAELLALDQTTVWDWVTGKWWVGAEVADLVRISVEALLSVEPTEISVYYFLWYCACNDGFLTEINDDVGGPQQYWLKKGTDQLAERYAEPVRDRIETGVTATTIDASGEGVRVRLEGGDVVEAKRVLVATSPATAARRIDFVPALSEARQELLAQPMGRTLKCQVYYREDWWHAAADGHAYDGYVGGAHYPILWVMDNSPPTAKNEGGPFVLMTFTVGDMLDSLGPHPSQEAIESYVTGALAKLFDDERALSTSSSFVRLVSYLWDPEEEQVGGGPNTVFLPGRLTSEAGKLLDQPWRERVYFASAENSLNPEPRSKSARWDAFAADNEPKYDDQANRLPEPAPPYFTKYSDRRKGLGYMDGAMSSGTYAARRIAADLGAEVALPEPPVRVPVEAPPPPKEVESAHQTAALAALRTALEGLTDEKLEAKAGQVRARGGRARVSWLRERLEEALRASGALAADAHPRDALIAVRDLAVALVAGLREPSGAEKWAGHMDAIERRLEEMFGRTPPDEAS